MNQQVSIILPLYNRIALIKETIESVQAQTYPYWEAIVVDDGSTDGSYALVEKIAQQDTRIKVASRHREPKGAPTCRNIGAERANGEYLLFLDSDDLLAPFCLERRVAVFRQHPDCEFLVFPMLMFQRAPYDSNILWNIDTEEDDLTRFLRVDAVWQTSGPIYRKSSFIREGGFQEGLSFWQDYELHTRTLISGPTYRKLLNQEPDCFYRQHLQDTVSQAVNVSEERLTTMEQVYRSLYSRLQTSPFNTSVNKEQISAMYFWINMVWVEHHKNVAKSQENWRYCYQQGIISLPQYVIGNAFFTLKYVQAKSGSIGLLFRVMAKPWVLLLPKVYRDRSVTTAKVSIDLTSYFGASAAEKSRR